MSNKTPQLLGIVLFLLINGFFFAPGILTSFDKIISPVPDIVTITTSNPGNVHFGEILAKEYDAAHPSPAVLGASSESATPASLPTPTPTISADNLQRYNLVSPKNGKATIAVLGDSMVDTLQTELPQLKILLAQAYPNYEFKLYNFGVGGENIESGLSRLTSEYDYIGTHHPSVLEVHPDILVIESFAYNPWSNSQSDLDRQWHDLSQMLDTVKSNSPQTKIILAATIAPNSDIFGDGVLNWSPEDKKNKTQIIKSYLQNLVNFSSSTRLPLADAYHDSLKSDGEGDERYISSSDHLHPSGLGGYLFFQKVVQAIEKNKLIE